jgi:hypothetical protein
MIRFLLLLLCVSISLNSVSAVKLKKTRTSFTLNRTMSLEELRDSASIIFLGKFLDFELAKKSGLDSRELKFKVKKVYKGLKPSTKKLVLREWAKTKSPFDVELIASDKDYVFFFYEPSEKGFTSLVGMQQGLVRINNDKSLGFSDKLGSRKYKQTRFLFFKSDKNIESYQDLNKFLSN